MLDAKALAAGLLKSIQDWLAPTVRSIDERLLSLDQAVKAIPAGERGEKGDPGALGERGADGADGKDGEPGPQGQPGQKGDPGERGADGANGKDGEPGPRGQPGQKGDPGEPGERGEKGERGEPGEKGDPGLNGKDGAPGERGADGKDADPEVVKQLVAQAVAHIPKPQDGKSVPVEDVQRMIAEAVAKAVPEAVAVAMAAVRVPKDGEPGRDAAHIEILPAIDEARSYPRGTFARHEGGLWRSFETTSAMKGWECIADAIADVSLEQVGERTVAFEVRLASGKTSRKEAVFPVTIHRGIWKDGETYARGDATTRDGSTWILMADQQKGKPGEDGSGWVLSTKRGRDGRDGLRGEKGERGAEGRPGRDLTQMGFDGSKH